MLFRTLIANDNQHYRYLFRVMLLSAHNPERRFPRSRLLAPNFRVAGIACNARFATTLTPEFSRRSPCL
jgi:hypothetical protein